MAISAERNLDINKEYAQRFFTSPLVDLKTSPLASQSRVYSGYVSIVKLLERHHLHRLRTLMIL